MAYTVKDFLVEQAPQIGVDINQKMMTRPTPWITLYKQETWEGGKSSVQKTFQFDRVKLTDPSGTIADDLIEEVEWADMSGALEQNNNTANHQASLGSNGTIPPADTAEFTQTLRDYNLQHKAIWGPPMNTDQLRDKFVMAQQMGACVKALADQSREFWIERKRSEYARISDNLIVLDSAFSLDGGDYENNAMPAYSGTDASILTNGFTDIIYEYLNHQGAGDGSLGTADSRPVYSLVTSPRQSRRLIMADPDIREDFRYSSQNEKLLSAMGVKWSYNGWSHMIDEKTNRWEFIASGVRTVGLVASTGVLTLSGAPAHILYKGSTLLADGQKLEVVSRTSATVYKVKSANTTPLANITAGTAASFWAKVPQFYVTSVNFVFKRVPNPAWLTATWEDSYVFHQGVCCSQVPKPITSVGRASFDAVNYAGEYKWTNYDDKENNPDGTIGQFRGVLANGTKPLNPEYGIVLRHLAVPSPDGRIMDGSSLG